MDRVRAFRILRLFVCVASAACGSTASPNAGPGASAGTGAGTSSGVSGVSGTSAGTSSGASAGTSSGTSAGTSSGASAGTSSGVSGASGGDAAAGANADGASSDAATRDAPGDAGVNPTIPTGMWVMGYYSGWDASYLPVGQIGWSGLTHIATAFMIPDGKGGFTSTSDANPSFDPTLASAVIAAAHAAGKQAIASIGGADSATAFEASTTSATLTPFVASLRALVTTTGYDGIDIDWEGGSTADDALLVELLTRLRAALPSATLTMTAGSINSNLAPTDLAALYAAAAPSVDQINLMTYGMSGAYSGWKSWHSSPLHWNHDGATPTGIDDTVSRYLAAGVPAKKLGIGSGFNGECYTAPVTAPDQALGASTISASDGFGNISYKDIVTTYLPLGTGCTSTSGIIRRPRVPA